MANEIRPTDQPTARPIPQSLRPPAVKTSHKGGEAAGPEAAASDELRSRLLATTQELESLQSGITGLHTRGRQLDRSLAELRQGGAAASAPAPEEIAMLIGGSSDTPPTVQQATERITELRARLDEDLGTMKQSILKGQVAIQNMVSVGGGAGDTLPEIPRTPPSHELNGANVLRLLEETP